MEQVRYRKIIQSVLSNYYQISLSQNHPQQSSEVSDRLAFDNGRDQYLWFRFGWSGDKLVQHIIIYICMKHDKVWVEQDATDLCIVDKLVSAGIPSEDIVLGFHHPSKRVLTDFAHV
ncbi:MAG: XisI protein [Symploca sp. SIO2B6]|nr:XisI protein [Symploca sp. SIO2B6]